MKRSPILDACLAAFALPFCVYAPSIYYGFVPMWDDGFLIKNEMIRGLDVEHIMRMFSVARNESSLRYQPLNYLLWAVNYRLSAFAPLSYHLSNVLLHAANAGLLCRLLAAILDRAGGPRVEPRHAAVAAAAGALFWSLHPLRVEAVAWAVARGHALAFFFLLLSALAYLRAASSKPWYAASIAAFAAACLSYPSALGGALIPLLLDIVPLRRLPLDPRRWLREEKTRRALLEKVPFALIGAALVAAALLTRSSGQGPWEKPADLREFGVLARALQAFYCWSSYLWKTCWPVNLSPFYTALLNLPPRSWFLYVNAAGLISVSALLWLRREKQPGVLMLWAGYLMLMIPFLGLTEGNFVACDRYSYIPAACWSIAIASRLRESKNGLQLRFALSAVGALVLVFVLLTAVQESIWKDEVSLYTAMTENLKGDPYEAHVAWRLGQAYLLRGDAARGVAGLDRTLAVLPDHGLARGLRGQYRLRAGLLDGAEEDLTIAIRQYPRAELFVDLARVKLQNGDASQARTLCERALQAAPGNAAARKLLDEIDGSGMTPAAKRAL